VTVGLTLLGASGTVKFLAGLIVALLVGFEAATIWRWTLARRRWSTLGFVIAEDRETAERRFFAEWVKRAGASPPPQATPTMPMARTAQPDVIGLFPEPGGSR